MSDFSKFYKNKQEGDTVVMAKIRDVAKEAGVAVGTVSMVLNHEDYGSKEIRQKVDEAVRKLHYVPSEMARNLSLQRTNTVGIIVPMVAHPFFAELVESLEESLYHLGYKTMLCCTQKKENAEHTFIEMLKRQTMDGIIMAAHSLDIDLYRGLKHPVIAFDRYLSEEIPIVHCNHNIGGQLAAKAFLRHGCQHIVEISNSPIVRIPALEYHRVFGEIMMAHGVRTDIVAMPWNAFSYSDYMKVAEELFDCYPDVDGILGSDLSVASCMHAAMQRGISVPQQLKIVAYDGTVVTRTGQYIVTAVRQPIADLADLAAQKIVHQIMGKQDSLPWVLPPTLLSGETC